MSLRSIEVPEEVILEYVTKDVDPSVRIEVYTKLHEKIPQRRRGTLRQGRPSPGRREILGRRHSTSQRHRREKSLEPIHPQRLRRNSREAIQGAQAAS